MTGFSSGFFNEQIVPLGLDFQRDESHVFKLVSNPEVVPEEFNRFELRELISRMDCSFRKLYENVNSLVNNSTHNDYYWAEISKLQTEKALLQKTLEMCLSRLNEDINTEAGE